MRRGPTRLQELWTDRALASLRGERLLRSIEGLQAGLSATQDEGVDIMSTLIGVDDLEVAHMAHHRKRVGYTVAAMHITRLSCDTDSFSRTVEIGRASGRESVCQSV